MDEFIKI